MITPDSSVAIAAAAPWHASHESALAALAETDSTLVAHVGFETTAALSRMPEGHRIAPEVVLEWLEQRFPGGWLDLPGSVARATLRTAVAAGVRGGALYDALIAATAQHHGHTLLSADRRAATTYRTVDVDVRFLV